MGGLRPIPVRLLPDVMSVRVPLEDGTLAEPVTISRVRFQRVQSICDDAHRAADAGARKVFVDAVSSGGAFEVPAGSRVTIGGNTYLVAGCTRCEDFNGHIHHWELDVR